MWSTTEYHVPPPALWQVKVLQGKSPEELEDAIHDFLDYLHNVRGTMVQSIQYGGFTLGSYSAMVVYIDAFADDNEDEEEEEED